MCENEEVRQFSRIHYDAKVSYQEAMFEHESLKSRLCIAESTLAAGQTQAMPSTERDSIFRRELNFNSELLQTRWDMMELNANSEEFANKMNLEASNLPKENASYLQELKDA